MEAKLSNPPCDIIVFKKDAHKDSYLFYRASTKEERALTGNHIMPERSLNEAEFAEFLNGGCLD